MEYMSDYHYIILVIILFILYIKNKNNNTKTEKWAFGIIFAFIGFRACVVGADTYEYTNFFLGYFSHYDDNRIEPLFRIYIEWPSKLLKSELFFILLNTVCTVIPLFVFINKFSKNPTLSLILFFLLEIYITYFVALRQILAISVLLIAYTYLIEGKRNKWIIYISLSIIAFFMHNSSIIASLMYVVIKYIPLNNKRIDIFVVIISAMVSIVFDIFNVNRLIGLFLSLNANFLDGRYSDYFQDDLYSLDTHSISAYLNLLKHAIMSIIVIMFIKKEQISHPFFKLYILSVVLLNLFQEIPMLHRLNVYFQIFSLITITWAITPCEYSFLQKRFSILPILILLYFSYTFIRSEILYDKYSSLRLHPYYFFWEDYKDHPSVTGKFNK